MKNFMVIASPAGAKQSQNMGLLRRPANGGAPRNDKVTPPLWHMTRFVWSLIFGLSFLAGCASQPGNVGNVQSYNFPPVEARWIRDGQPIEFEGELWYPADGIETLMDAEVYYLGDYKGTQFFIDKLDVRPYERLYTKYGKNQFRYFQKEKKP